MNFELQFWIFVVDCFYLIILVISSHMYGLFYFFIVGYAFPTCFTLKHVNIISNLVSHVREMFHNIVVFWDHHNCNVNIVLFSFIFLLWRRFGVKEIFKYSVSIFSPFSDPLPIFYLKYLQIYKDKYSHSERLHIKCWATK
jgi:hypothetical protein